MLEIKTDRLLIRDFCQEDFDFYEKMEADPLTVKYELDQPPSYQEIKDKFEGFKDLQIEGERAKYHLILVLRESLQPVGRLVLWSTKASIREWEMGWIMSPDYYGRGYASEGAKGLMAYAFDQLKAHRLIANCNANNLGSERVMQKIGMSKEACLRETRYLNQSWQDSSLYAILEDEYKSMEACDRIG